MGVLGKSRGAASTSTRSVPASAGGCSRQMKSSTQARFNSGARGFLAEMLLLMASDWRLAKVRRFSKQERFKKL